MTRGELGNKPSNCCAVDVVRTMTPTHKLVDKFVVAGEDLPAHGKEYDEEAFVRLCGNCRFPKMTPASCRRW